MFWGRVRITFLCSSHMFLYDLSPLHISAHSQHGFTQQCLHPQLRGKLRKRKHDMMKILILAVSVAILATLPTSSEARCKRAIKTCNVTGVLEDYNDCVQMCCGAELFDRDTYFGCCGNEERGIPYNTKTQMCCSWPFGNEYIIHNKTEGAWCCGSELFDPVAQAGLSCCNGWEDKPALFSSITEMCCDGVVGFSGDTAYTSCCGSVSFDRRIASCPCHNGQIGLIPEALAACCQNSDGTKTPYNTETQECCNGVAFDKELQFCCNGLVGEVGTEVCCGDSIVARDPNQAIDNVACCTLSDGSQELYDSTQSVCCGGVVQTMVGNDTQICCDGNLFDVTSGDSCCNDVPFFSSDSVCCTGQVEPGNRCCNGVGFSGDTNVCCEGVISPGNRCCNDVGFSGDTDICCEGVITPGNLCCNGVGFYGDTNVCCGGVVTSTTYKYPSCCVNATFDSNVQTCCGGVLFDNPEYTSLETGELVVSHKTRCCGDFTNDQTLLPYDYDNSICCDGNIVDLEGTDATLAQCCGGLVINTAVTFCCQGSPVDRWFGAETGCCNGTAMNKTSSVCCGEEIIPNDGNTECCGSTGMDATQFICCNGAPRALNGVPRENAICCGSIGMDTTQFICCNGLPRSLNGVPRENATCCGSTGMDAAQFLCCDGVPRSLNGVPRENAICCGKGCIDGSKFFCCDGKQYQKGNTDGVDVTGLTCDSLFL